MKREMVAKLLAGANAALLVAAVVFPIRTTITRATIVVTGVLLIPLLLMALWRRRWMRYVLGAVGGLGVVGVLLILLVPGKPASAEELRGAYMRSLKSYEDVRYVWGGETHLGIDCSALPRIAWMDAHFSVGLREVNAAALREGAFLWWHDCAARDMPGGYHGRLRLLAANPEALRPGDIAVTADGSHALAYLGKGEWIEANPGPGKVILSTQDDYWMHKLRFLRWVALP